MPTQAEACGKVMALKKKCETPEMELGTVGIVQTCTIEAVYDRC